MSDFSMTAAHGYEVSICISGFPPLSSSHPVFSPFNFAKPALAKFC